MSDLFRSEAVSHQAKSLQGEVIVGTRLPWLLLGYILSGFLFAVLAVIVFAQYSRKETVSGILTPQAGIIRVTATQGGVITNIAAKEGQALVAGDAVAELRPAENPVVLNPAGSHGRPQKPEQVRSASAYSVTAPIDGIVVATPLSVGQTVQPGSTIVVLTPRNSPLEAELYVPSRAFGFVRPGQEVSLQYQAFSYKTFGAGKGRIVAVSHAPLTPAEAAMSGVSTNEPVFKVRVALEKDYVMAYGSRAQLFPGMLLNADIVIERRSIIDWLLDPLYAVGKK